MKRKIKEYINEHKLLSEKAKTIIALSGGADSVALLRVMHALGYECHAVHCNFHLRGEESMRDEKFVRELCSKHGVPLHVIDFDTEKYAKDRKISIEMAARDLRYDAFEQLRLKIKAEAIATAHHRNDTAETMLLNLIRGTGLKGLHGIRPKNGHIVRPFLCISREEIIQYLHKIEQEYVTDSTNLQANFNRNKIRLELLPLMQKINPSIIATLADTAERIAQAEKIYDIGIKEGITRVRNGNHIYIDKLPKEPSPINLLHEILSPLGFNSSQTVEILKALSGNSGKCFESNEWIVVKDRNSLIISEKKDREFDTVILPETGNIMTVNGILSIEKGIFDGNIPIHRNNALLDADTLIPPLTLRKTVRGDRFHPYGMKGSKLVSDYLTDCKRNVIEKERQLVVTDAKENIIWLVNERPAAPYCVTKSTKNIIRLTWLNKN